jgi:hypothetical protein
MEIMTVNHVGPQLQREANRFPPKARYLDGQTPTGAIAGLNVLDPEYPSPVEGFLSRQLTAAIRADHGDLMPASRQGLGFMIDTRVGTKRIGKNHHDTAHSTTSSSGSCGHQTRRAPRMILPAHCTWWSTPSSRPDVSGRRSPSHGFAFKDQLQ